jgi:hypothetical protein
MARPGWSSTRPSTVARWYSTDSAPIIRIQPTGSPRLDKPRPNFLASHRLAIVFDQYLSFIRARSPFEEAVFGSGTNGK